MPIATTHHAKLNYLQLRYKGEGQAEDMVMVHGLAANMAFWLQDYAQYFAQYFNVTLYDLRGHGRSEMTPSGYGAVDMAVDLAGLMDTLNIEKSHVIAHSFGGAVALNLPPERLSSLVLADTHISLCRKPDKTWKNRDSVAAMIRQFDINLNVDDPYFGYKLLTEVARLRLRGRELPANLFPWVQWIFGGGNTRAAERWLALMEQTQAVGQLAEDGLCASSLAKITCPALLLYGDASQSIATGEYLAKVLPNAQLVVLEKAGHFFPKAYPQLVQAHCNQFYKQFQPVEAIC